MTERIPVAGPWVTELEVRYVAEAAEHGWYERAGHYVQRFEQAFAEYLGVRHAISVPHCTSALHLALAGLGLKPGDEVIVPDITWIASAAPAQYVGAVPVFADIDPITWCMSAGSVRECITPRTRAIIPVDLYGLLPDMLELRQLADEHGLHVIEDAAQAIGSRFGDRLAGTFGDAAVFSFHGTKTLTTGEGGMLVTNDGELHERALLLRDHGRSRDNFRNFYNTEVAYKYRMSSLQAAFGLGQLERIEQLIARKREIFGWYKERLSGIAGLQLNAEPSGYFNTCWMVNVVVDTSYGLDTPELMRRFDREAIDTRPFFHPLSALPAYSATREAQDVAYALSPRAINLPSAMKLSEAQVDRVCATLRSILG
jgi:perosamine synthetase